MAKIDKINAGSWTDYCVNLTRPVGDGAPNDFYDVLLIQALFKYISTTDFDNPYKSGLGMLGLGDEGDGFVYEVPKLNGIMDLPTITAIRQFQIANQDRLLVRMYDGVIEPAKYKSRTLWNVRTARLLSITLLHEYASDAEIARGDTHYIHTLKTMSASLADSFVINTEIDTSNL